jgi:hypothetical protein
MQTGGRYSSEFTHHELDDMVVLAVKLMMMIDCSCLNYNLDRLEQGDSRLDWKDNIPFSRFIQESFPVTTHTVLSFPDQAHYAAMKSDLRATKLQKHLSLRLRPTNDLRDHLKMDRANRVLKIFHHAGFLKRQLLLTKDLPRDSSVEDSLRL